MTIRLTTLDNGLRIVSEARPMLETVSVGLWVDVGSRHEPAPLNGVTHCLEHMLFKGTERRTAQDIVLEIESVGGHINAYTSRDHTTYYARTLKDDLPLAVDLLADILMNSVFDEGELTREKDVILQEIGQARDTPDDIVFDHLQSVAYPDQSLGWSILGTPDTVRSFNRDALFSFMADKYRAGSIIVAAVGNLDHDRLVDMARSRFSGLPSGRREADATARYAPGCMVEQRPLEQVHLALAWPGVAHKAPEYYATQIYSTILGGGMSSRLFQKIREERGLAYSIYSFSASHADTGLLGVYAGTSPDQAETVLSLIEEDVQGLGAGATPAELASAKAQLKAGLMMALEATGSRMEQLGRQMLIYGRVIPTEEILMSLDAVTPDDVAAVATRMAESGTRALAAVGGGPVEDLLKAA